MNWRPVAKFGAFVVAAFSFLGVLLGIYEFYFDNIRTAPMFVYIDDQVELAPVLDDQSTRERFEVVFRFTNTSDEPASPRFVTFHDEQGEALTISPCVLGGPNLPPVFEPDETARTSCRTAWVDVPLRDETTSVFSASPLSDAVSRICSVRVWLAGDGNSDGLQRSYEFGTDDYRRSNC